MAIVINSTTPTIQPESAEWERTELDRDGNNKPIFGPIRSLRLTFPEGMSRAQFTEWYNLWTGSSVAMTLPHPGTGADTSYAGRVVEVKGRFSDLNVYDVQVLLDDIMVT